MSPPAVLVVGEIPSLGESIADLLEAERVPHRTVPRIDTASPLSTLRERFSVVVVAGGGYFCEAGRRWLRGEFPDVRLLVVGSRDPYLVPTHGLYRVHLPLEPKALVDLIRRLSEEAATAGPRAPTPAADRSVRT